MTDHKSATGVNFRNTPAVNTDASKRAEQLFAKVTNTMKAMEELKKNGIYHSCSRNDSGRCQGLVCRVEGY